MNLPRIVFAGTPDFSVPCLVALLKAEVNIVGVYTQPDRPAGRGKKQQQSPVKKCALQNHIPVFQPDNFTSSSARSALSALEPDLMIVVAYGLILPQSVLAIPRLGCLNLHASLLPRWRGAAPIQRAIEAGDTRTGVCLMQMEKGLDSGPVFARYSCSINTNETGGSLHDKLSTLAATLLTDKLNDVLEQNIQPQPQASEGLTYAHKLSKDEMRIDWQLSAIELANKVRAFSPWPVMSTTLQGRPIKIHGGVAKNITISSAGKIGQIHEISNNGISVITGDGLFTITELQKSGGKVLCAREFLNGFALNVGQQFE